MNERASTLMLEVESSVKHAVVAIQDILEEATEGTVQFPEQNDDCARLREIQDDLDEIYKRLYSF